MARVVKAPFVFFWCPSFTRRSATFLMHPRMDAAVLILDNYQPTAPPPVPAHGEKGSRIILVKTIALNVNIQALWHLRIWREQLLAK